MKKFKKRARVGKKKTLINNNNKIILYDINLVQNYNVEKKDKRKKLHVNICIVVNTKICFSYFRS